MSRCAVCDYLEEPSNSPYKFNYTSKKNRVMWNSKRNEFECDNCTKSIEQNIRESSMIHAAKLMLKKTNE